jgi:DNA-binding HxlR family transcriptional regulator
VIAASPCARLKLIILFQLFGEKEAAFLGPGERSIPRISQKMLVQQLRQMEAMESSGASAIQRSPKC